MLQRIRSIFSVDYPVVSFAYDAAIPVEASHCPGGIP